MNIFSEILRAKTAGSGAHAWLEQVWPQRLDGGKDVAFRSAMAAAARRLGGIALEADDIQRLAALGIPRAEHWDLVLVGRIALLARALDLLPADGQPDFLRRVFQRGASRAFAVCDHQIAHVYVKNAADIPQVQRLLAGLEGVETVLDTDGKRAFGLDHERSGELVAISRADRWFAYYHWLDDARAMDYARTVDIHRKPGYDPVELFIDPAIRFPKLAIGRRLATRALGFRTLMDVIPLDAGLVRGSHGRLTDRAEDGPLVIGSIPELLPEGPVQATAVKDLILAHVFGDR